MYLHFESMLTGNSNKNNRVKLSVAQTSTLLEMFKSNPIPNYIEREEIGTQLGLKNDKVKNWFQNRRAKLRLEQKEKIWFNNRQPKIKTISKVKTYPGVNNFWQPRDYE